MSQERDWDPMVSVEEVLTHYADRVKGRNVLVTGVSLGGVGAAFARALAGAGAGLIVCTGRDSGRLEAAIKSIKEEHANANLRPLMLDLADLASVRKAAKEVLEYKESLDVVVTNAAVMASPLSRTKDGFENQFGSNHLGHFVFVNTILPRLLASATADYTPRFVSVSSLGHRNTNIIWEDPNFKDETTYNKWKAYGQSKTANCNFAVSLKDAGLKLTTFSVHPGGVATDLARHLTMEEKTNMGLYDKDGNINTKPMEFNGKQIMIKNPSQGAASYAVAAFDPTIGSHSGSYFYETKLDNGEALDYALDSANAARLWKLSEELVGEKFDLSKLK